MKNIWTSDKDQKFNRKLFTELINQLRSRFIFFIILHPIRLIFATSGECRFEALTRVSYVSIYPLWPPKPKFSLIGWFCAELPRKEHNGLIPGDAGSVLPHVNVPMEPHWAGSSFVRSPALNLSWWRGCNLTQPWLYHHPVFWSLSRKTPWPWRYILKHSLHCQVFFLKPNPTESPVHMEGTVRHCVAQWHKWVFVLPCGSYIISSLQLQDWLPGAGGFGGRSPWYAWPDTEPIWFLSLSQELLFAWSQPFFVPMKVFPGLVRSKPHFPVLCEPCCFGSGAAGTWALLVGRSMPRVLLHESMPAAAAPSHPAFLPAWAQLFQP